MAAPIPDIRIAEDQISEIIKADTISSEEQTKIGYLLGYILDGVFPTLDRESGLRGWCVDEMYPDECHHSTKKITLMGSVNWLHGGGNCTRYQVDIARDTVPMLYSYKFTNSKREQSLYVGKTFRGWIVNVA